MSTPRKNHIAVKRLNTAIEDLEDRLWTIQLFRNDCIAREEGYHTTIAVDFSELYRYLHPDLDRAYFENRRRYYADQVAIRYLFDASSEPILILRPYYQEFVDHFDKLRLWGTELYTELLYAKPDVVETRLARFRSRNEIKRIIQMMGQRAEVTDDSHFAGSVNTLRSRLLDLFIQDIREAKITNAVQKFKDLVDTKRIVSEYLLNEVDTDYHVDEKDHRFIQILADMMRSRPDRHHSNIIDAKAAMSLSLLNSRNSKHKHLFLLVSSATQIYDVLSTIRVSVRLRGELVELPIVRNTCYGLLMLYLEPLNIQQREAKLESLTHIFTEFHDATVNLRDYIVEVQKQGQEVSPQLVSRAQRLYERATEWPYFLVDTLYPEFQEIPSWDLEQIKKMLTNIQQILDNPAEFREELEKLFQGLSSATKQLREIASLLLPAGTPIEPTRMFPYPFRVVDEKYKRACEDIMGLLATRAVEDTLLAQQRAATLLAQAPDSADVHAIVARVLIRINRTNEAEEEISRVREIYPQHPEIPLVHALIAKRRDDIPRAIEWAKQAVENFPEDPRSWKELAYDYWLQNEKAPEVGDQTRARCIDIAIDYANRALELTSGEESIRMWILNDISYYLAERSNENDIRLAMDHIKEAFRINERHQLKLFHLWDTKGYVYLRAFLRSEPRDYSLLATAWECFAKALQISPTSEYPSMHIKQCLELGPPKPP